MACPVDCIEIETIKSTPDVDLGLTSVGTKKRLYVPRFDIDIAKCCYCALCVYPCPTECIKMTDVYEFAEYERQNLVYSFATMTPEEIDRAKSKLLAHEKEQAAKKAAAAARPAAAAPAQQAAQAGAAAPKPPTGAAQQQTSPPAAAENPSSGGPAPSPPAPAPAANPAPAPQNTAGPQKSPDTPAGPDKP
jgi:NADH-quinone oxidoreductase subunit I